jgi:Tfp pilus assembly protein PilN
MRAVNLLPRDETRVQLEGARTASLLAVGGLVLVTVVTAALAVSAARSAADSKAELDAVKAAIAKLPRAPKPVVSQGVLARERTDRVSALAAALSSRVAVDRLLRDVSRVLPEDAWLTGLTAAAPTDEEPTASAAPTAGEGVSIQGATYTHDAVARVLSRLAVVPSLDDVVLQSSSVVVPDTGGQTPERDRPQGKRIVTFTVAATFRGAS